MRGLQQTMYRCRGCGKVKTFDDFRNKISEREWEISGLCQECQDKVFGVD